MAGQPVAGVGPLVPVQGVTVPQPYAQASAVQGGSADPRHAASTVQQVYPWQGVPTPGAIQHPYVTDPDLWHDQTVWSALPAGVLTEDPRGDQTPIYGHAAPWPTTGVHDSEVRTAENAARQAQMSADIHASGMGSGREILYEDPLPKTPVAVYQWDTAGTTLLVDVPNQIKDAGMGAAAVGPNTDRVQSHARQNEYGFDGAHERDRRIVPGVPGNFLWLRPGGRPLVIDPHGSTNTFDGQDSPFSGAGLQKRTRRVKGGLLLNQAQVYSPPPEAADLVVAAPPPAEPSWSSGLFG